MRVVSRVGGWTSFIFGFFALVEIAMAQFVGISGISGSCDITDIDPAAGNDYSYSSDCFTLYAFYCPVFCGWCVFMVLLDFTEQVSIQLTI